MLIIFDNEKIKRLFSFVLALIVVIGLMPVNAFAAETDSLCEHHTEHTGVHNEGDYLCWHVAAWNIQFDSATPGADGKKRAAANTGSCPL